MRNIVFCTDSYKVSHWKQFPKDMTGSYYYIEARGGGDKVLFFGLQAILKKMLSEVPSRAEIFKAKKFWEEHGLPFNYEGWLKINRLCYFPLRINAVTEGELVDVGKPLVTIESTDPETAWLPGWIETRLMQLWYPVTVATRTFECKKIIYNYLKLTGDESTHMFKLHSFGYRGVSSEESAEIGGMAELLTSMGTDTVAGIFAANEYYSNGRDTMLGFSIPASEHSTITSWGKDGELAAYENMIDMFCGPNRIVACVSDSYDLSNAVINLWGGKLRDKVKNNGGVLVIRPDSGDPTTIVMRTLREMETVFGSEKNEKGFKTLPPYVRLIQGDGISSPEVIQEILQNMVDNGWSADNIAFGMGGGSLQQVNRDTYKFAMKMSAIKRGDVWYDVFKQPKDCPWKVSKAGRFDNDDRLSLVWENGRFQKEYNFSEIRQRAVNQL